MMIDGVEYLPLAEVMKRSGYNREYLRNIARRNQVRARKVGRDWYYEIEALDAYRAGNPNFRKPRRAVANE